MDVYTSSRGIANNPQVSYLLKTNKVRLLSFLSPKFFKRSNPVLVGWGYKPNTLKTRALALKHQLSYWALEDGFISWLNHPSQSKPYQRLSYIIDQTGMYYDASKPSGLDLALNEQADIDEPRIDRLREQLLKLGISKYNQARCQPENWPSWLQDLKQGVSPVLLLVDQTVGDASIEYSGGGTPSFEGMLSWAVERLVQEKYLHVIIKTHPDVLLGKKSGYLFDALKGLSLLDAVASRIHVLTDDVAPAELISMASEVATVSSQMGFEALWQEKPVSCFAWPFYAGRGLTSDRCEQPLVYQRQPVSLNRLLQAALIDYPIYLHPDTQDQCEVEAIVDYLQAHFLTRDMQCDSLAVPNVSLWKRSFLPEFVSASAGQVRFTEPKSNDVRLLWGMKQQDEQSCWRIEDGFIRSVGLGADLRRPSSLVLDDKGIYYNGKQASRLESLLEQYDLNAYEHCRAVHLLEQLRESNITKYNVESSSDVAQFVTQANGKEIVLVTGQFQQDLSMQFGAHNICDNLTLLQQVKADFPHAFVIYKEHPDVYSGVRPGRIDEVKVFEYADAYVTDTSLTDLFSITQRLCTICSLAGFEALTRGLAVTTYGLPFYGGWGLTDDKCDFPRRTRMRTIEELAYIALVLYGRYVNWNTRQITTVESTINTLVCDRPQTMQLKTSWIARQSRKIGYLSQALFKTHRSFRIGSRS
ncbi:MAG: capsular polysaccharide export protein [Bermanella sp.]|jgi:capsular polysaccharide export protein